MRCHPEKITRTGCAPPPSREACATKTSVSVTLTKRADCALAVAAQANANTAARHLRINMVLISFTVGGCRASREWSLGSPMQSYGWSEPEDWTGAAPWPEAGP